MFHESLSYLLALQRLSCHHFNKLNKIIGDVAQSHGVEEFVASKLNEEIFQKFDTSPDWINVERDLEWAQQKNCHVVHFWDESYPLILKKINYPPLVLFVKGNVEQLKKPALAIVGSRNPTVNGQAIAFRFSEYFSKANFSITSGLAIGIDTRSHEGALQGAGGTISVLASGLDEIYPLSNLGLANKIVEQGALVSEFPIGLPPKPGFFPRRNRIISGLSMGTLVVEAALKSGSLITARFALEQGREVFAVPGSIYSPFSKGCHALIRQGAKLVEHPEDVLEELSALINFVEQSRIVSKIQKNVANCNENKKTNKRKGKLLTKPTATTVAIPLGARASGASEFLLDQMGYEPVTIDTLVERSQLTSHEVSIMLLELELAGKVLPVPQGYQKILFEV